MTAIPGFALVVSPKHATRSSRSRISPARRSASRAPGSSTDFFLKYLLSKNGVDPNSVGVIGVGLGATAVAAMEQGKVDAAIMLDPAVTLLQSKYKDLKILSDTRTQKDTLEVFGGEYPGGALYTRADWIAGAREGRAGHDQRDRRHAEVDPLAYAEEIMDKMPAELVGTDKALYLAALKNTMPMYSETGLMDPKGAQAVLAVFSQSVAGDRQGQHRPVEDLHQQVRRGGGKKGIETAK